MNAARRHLAIGAVALLMGSACSGSRGSATPPANPEADGEASMPTGARIVFERTACLGACPVYEVVLHDDGRVEWTGKEHVAVVVSEHGQVAPADVAGLWERLQAWHDRERSATNAKEGCVRVERTEGTTVMTFAQSDQPGTTIRLRTQGEAWSVVHDHGCPMTPSLERLRALEDEIDAVAGTERWVEPR